MAGFQDGLWSTSSEGSQLAFWKEAATTVTWEDDCRTR